MTRNANRVPPSYRGNLSFATGERYRQGENPARWKDHLGIPIGRSLSKLAKPEHFAAIPTERSAPL